MRRRGKWHVLGGGPLALALLPIIILGGSAPAPDAPPSTMSHIPAGDRLAARGSGGPDAGAESHSAPPSAPEPTTSPAGAPTVDPTVALSPSIGPIGEPTVKPTPKSTPVPPTPPPPPPTPVGPTPGPPTPGPVPPLSACSIFPSTNVWNRRVDGLPVAADSDAMIAAIGLAASLHPDFSNAGGYGIPFNVVGASTPLSTVGFQYDDESDQGGYPIPSQPKIEGGSDRHILIVDTDVCALYELYAAAHGSGGWTAGSGATWNLGSNALRADGWTSADAAGLPIFPGLVRYPEVAAGAISHAIRFTAPQACNGHTYPARHDAGSGSCSSRPPMGLRVRLKASVDLSGYGPQSRVILVALRRHGMLLADNGSPWYITGAPDSRWDDDELHGLGGISGADFEVVNTTGFVNG
jgi:hypothetical protein